MPLAGVVNLWSTESGSKQGTLDPHGKFAMSVAYSPDGRLIATGDGALWFHPSTSVCPTPMGQPRTEFCVGVPAAAEGAVTVFDVNSGTPVCKLEGHNMAVRALAFGPDSGSLLTGSDDKCIHLHDIKAGNLVASLGGHGSWVLGLARSPR